MSKDQPRNPRGVPDGGQWTTPVRGEASVTLDTPAVSAEPPRAGCAVGWEERSWESDPSAPVSRREWLRARGPYRAAVPARIADWQPPLANDVEAEAAEATAEIARFDADISHALPALGGAGPDGELAPLAAVLLRTESASSSQIEHVTAGARALALATIAEKTGPNAALVAGNVEAMRTAIALADRIDVGTILAAHEALLHDQPRDEPGLLRTQQVWIGGRGNSPHSATLVPPHHDRVPEALDDLVSFCARADLAPLPLAALAHAQFETIHPFIDGNGRTGRTLVHAMLRHNLVTLRVTVPISAGLLTDTESYFRALADYRRGQPDPIVSRFSQAAFTAVANGRTLVDDLVEVHASWTGRVQARSDAAAWKVLPLLLRQPAVNVTTVQAATGVSQPAAHNAIDQLVRAAVLTPATAGRRNRVWVATEVTDALDAFAERAGRRSLG